MTTGRINQVTILTGGPEASPRPAAKRAEQFTEKGRAQGTTQLAGDPEQRLQQAPTNHPIAPTEFPKGRSTALKLGRQAPSQGVILAPQEEDTFHRSRQRRIPAWAYPQMSYREVWPSASNPQTPTEPASEADRTSGT